MSIGLAVCSKLLLKYEYTLKSMWWKKKNQTHFFLHSKRSKLVYPNAMHVPRVPMSTKINKSIWRRRADSYTSSTKYNWIQTEILCKLMISDLIVCQSVLVEIAVVHMQNNMRHLNFVHYNSFITFKIQHAIESIIKQNNKSECHLFQTRGVALLLFNHFCIHYFNTHTREA